MSGCDPGNGKNSWGTSTEIFLAWRHVRDAQIHVPLLIGETYWINADNPREIKFTSSHSKWQ